MRARSLVASGVLHCIYIRSDGPQLENSKYRTRYLCGPFCSSARADDFTPHLLCCRSRILVDLFIHQVQAILLTLLPRNYHSSISDSSRSPRQFQPLGIPLARVVSAALRVALSLIRILSLTMQGQSERRPIQRG